MTNEERVERFKSHMIVVNCETKEETQKFLKWWDEQKITFVPLFNYNDKLCFRFDESCVLDYGSLGFYKKYNYPIVTYKDFFKEDEMTNLEYVIKSIKKNEPDCRKMLCDVIYEFKNKTPCCGKCPECEFSTHINVLEYLAEKHEEKHDDKIKVTQFEYDLLDSLKKIYNGSCNFVDINKLPMLTEMKEKGYFKNININMHFGELCEKLEVEA